MLNHFCSFFFFNDTATTEIYTLSLHDALPISRSSTNGNASGFENGYRRGVNRGMAQADEHALGSAPSEKRLPFVVQNHKRDRKSTRLNSSHANISYAVFCLKKKRHLLHDDHNY